MSNKNIIEEKRKKKIKRAAHDFAIRFEGVMKELAGK